MRRRCQRAPRANTRFPAWAGIFVALLVEELSILYFIVAVALKDQNWQTSAVQIASLYVAHLALQTILGGNDTTAGLQAFQHSLGYADAEESEANKIQEAVVYERSRRSYGLWKEGHMILYRGHMMISIRVLEPSLVGLLVLLSEISSQKRLIYTG